MILFDQNLTKYIYNFLHNDLIYILSQFFSGTGYFLYVYILFFAILIYFLYRKFSYRLVYIFVFFGLFHWFIRLIKNFVARQRPYQFFGRSENHCPSDYSFPSEHTAIFVLSFLIFWNLFPRFRYIFMILAGLVWLSRVALWCHFAGDVLVWSIIWILWYYIYLYLVSRIDDKI